MTRHRTLRPFVMGAGALALMSTCSAAWQDARAAAPSNTIATQSEEIETITVTARKREENIQNVPMSVTAITDKDLAKIGIRRIGDLQLEVTNLNLAKTQTNTINAIIRGVGSFRNVNGVGFFYDDIQDFNAYAERLFDIDHVEVLKGPQATLYGGLNIGGAIKYVLKQPQFDWGAEGDITAGNYGEHTEEATVTGPLIDDVLAFRLSGYQEHTDGIFKNLFNNSKIGGTDEYGGRIAFLANLDHLQISLEVRANKYSTSRQQLQTNSPTPDSVNFIVFAEDPVFNRTAVVAPTLKLVYDFGDATLTSITGYNFTHTHFLADSANLGPPAGTGLPYLPLVRINRTSNDTAWQQEVRLESKDDTPLTWIVGAYYLHRLAPMVGITNLLSNPFTSPLPPFTPVVTIHNHNRYFVEQYAAFASATYKFGDGWEATLGARGNVSHNSFTDFLAAEPIVLNGANAVVPKGVPSKVNDAQFLPRLELSYHFSPDMMVYGTISRGVQPGGAAVYTSSSGQPFKDEWTTAYELGLKSQFFDHRLQVNAAVFYTDYLHRTFTQAVTTPAGPIRINSNIGNGRNLGFEADVLAKPMEELSLHLGFGYINSEWVGGTIYNFKSLVPPGPVTPVDLTGLNSPSTPNWTLNASAEWVHPLTDYLDFTSRIDFAFVGSQFWDLLNTYASSSYSLVNASVGLEYQDWSVAVQVRNVFNTRYNLDWLPARDSGAAVNLANPGDPRMFTVTLAAKI